MTSVLMLGMAIVRSNDIRLRTVRPLHRARPRTRAFSTRAPFEA
jgi:hypothetical protein